MHAALVLHPGVGAIRGYLGDGLLVAAAVALAERQQLDGPPASLRVARVHAVEVRGKEGRLLPARTGPHLDDHAPVVIGVAGHKKASELDLERVAVLLEALQLLVSHGAYLLVGIGGELLGCCLLRLQLAHGANRADHRLEARKLSSE